MMERGRYHAIQVGLYAFLFTLVASAPARVDAAGVVVVYAGYIGGDDSDFGASVAVDAAGFAYVAGASSSPTGFPVLVGPDLTYNGQIGDAFVAKVREDGSGLVYAGYIGGADWDDGLGIAADAGGNAYVCGWTRSDQATFPVTVGPDLILDGIDDAFVAKVSSDGSRLDYCGYIGGTRPEVARGIAVDLAGSAYVTGETSSDESSFPVLGGPDLSINGYADAYVAKVRPDGTGLDYCGYIGGDSSERAEAIAVDPGNSAYVTGETGSSEATFPVRVGPDLTYNDPGPGSNDAFVAKLTADGLGLVYLGYIGGTGGEEGHGIAVDVTGAAYVAGSTTSTEADFPVLVGPDLVHTPPYYDAFITKVEAGGSSLAYSGFIGGIEQDYAWAVAVDGTGSAHVIGTTISDETSFPVAGGPDLTWNGGEDAFLAVVRADGSGFSSAGYIGGLRNDAGWGVAVDPAGNAYVAGVTDSSEATFPVLVGPDTTFQGWSNAFVVKLGAGSCIASASEIRQLQAVKQPGNPDHIDFTWLADPVGLGYNLWYVESAPDIPLASQSGVPTAMPVTGCATPSPALSTVCTDAGAVPRRSPAHFFYQVHTYCDDSNEGP